MGQDMKASSILGSVILVLILMGAPLLVIPSVDASQQQQMTCTPPANGSCAVFNGTATTTIDSNGTKTTVLNTQTVCDDGSHADSRGMCHYPICPDGTSPVGKGTCVGPEMGECIHAADGNGNCRGMTYCGGPATVSNGFTTCADTAPTNASLTLPPLRCDQSGYVSCYKFGYNAGFDLPTSPCPMIGYANAGTVTQASHYCSGFKAGQIQEPIYMAKLAKAPSPACSTHTPSCCVGKNGEIIGNATDRRCA